MLQELNPTTRVSTARTAAVTRPNPRVHGSRAGDRANQRLGGYDSMQVSLHQKRYSNHYQVRMSYTLFGGRRQHREPRRHRDDHHADPETTSTWTSSKALTAQDRPHILSLSGSVEVPHTKGLNRRAACWQYNSGTPFTITDSSTDPDRNGRFQEPLAAGTYSGAATNPKAITVENEGGFNGARGPNFSLAEHARGVPVQAPRQPAAAGASSISSTSRTARTSTSHPNTATCQRRRSPRCGDVPHAALDPNAPDAGPRSST